MNMIEAVKNVLSNYATFEGRASRSEYWWYTLAWLLIYMILIFLGVATGDSGQISGLGLGLLAVFLLGTIVPTISVLVRRLHDVGKSGWWYWISLVPFIGGIWLLVLTVTASDGPNEYGQGPA